jgi:protein phosphatase
VGAAVRIRYYAQELSGRDIMMLSSDGLHGVAPVGRMEEILADDTPLEQKCRNLIEAAHGAGSPDNITVILLRPAK